MNKYLIPILLLFSIPLLSQIGEQERDSIVKEIDEYILEIENSNHNEMLSKHNYAQSDDNQNLIVKNYNTIYSAPLNEIYIIEAISDFSDYSYFFKFTYDEGKLIHASVKKRIYSEEKSITVLLKEIYIHQGNIYKEIGNDFTTQKLIEIGKDEFEIFYKDVIEYEYDKRK